MDGWMDECASSYHVYNDHTMTETSKINLLFYNSSFTHDIHYYSSYANTQAHPPSYLSATSTQYPQRTLNELKALVDTHPHCLLGREP